MERRALFALVLAVLAALWTPAYAGDGFVSDRIAVTTRGSGPDVVLIPGLGSSPRVWESTVEAVPGYRYHLIHVAGFAGQPARGNAQGPVSAPVADEIARYIKERGLGAPAVVGHSMGGTIGLMLAARHPEAVGRLMVVDMLPFVGAVFGPPGTTAEALRPVADKLVGEMRAGGPEARRARTAAMIGAMVRNEAERAPAIADVMASDPEVSARAYHELILTDLRPELAKIAAPTTVLYVNPAGVPLTNEQVDALYRSSFKPLKQVKLVRIPDSAHFIMADAPERFRREMQAFVGRQGG